MAQHALAAVADLDLEREFARHRPALTGYCYRMLGSTFEADDAVQETLVRAWRGRGGFEGRSSVRSWLYKIATNVCFDALNARRRRAVPMELVPPSSGAEAPAAPDLEARWIEPVPDAHLRPASVDDNPAHIATQRDDIRLAFVAALQHLQPRPRAVLLLRDVFGWRAEEVAELLEMTPTAVHSALQRARRTLATRRDRIHGGAAPLDETDAALLDRYVAAFERFDISALVALLRHDATMSMPPHDLWLRGPAAINRWMRGTGSACRGARMLRTRANGGPAVGIYKPTPAGDFAAFAIQVVEASGPWIVGLHTFIDPRLFPEFGLPLRLGEQHLGEAGERDQVA